MKTFHKRGGGGVNRISYFLFKSTYVPKNTVKFLNKDFIKAVRGGGGPVLGNFFKKFRIFLKECFPKGAMQLRVCMIING